MESQLKSFAVSMSICFTVSSHIKYEVKCVSQDCINLRVTIYHGFILPLLCFPCAILFSTDESSFAMRSCSVSRVTNDSSANAKIKKPRKSKMNQNVTDMFPPPRVLVLLLQRHASKDFFRNLHLVLTWALHKWIIS